MVQKDQSKKNFSRKSLVSRHDLNPVGICCKNGKSEETSKRLIILWDGIDFAFDEIEDHTLELEPMKLVTNEHVLDISDEKKKEQ